MSNIEPTRVIGASTAMDRTQVMGGGPQATMVMPGQGDAFRTQMGGTTTCPVCKSTTPLMDPFCGDCGFLLASAPAEPIVAPVEEAPAGALVDSQSGRRFRLRAGVNTLGRQGTDILVNEGTVSRNHATITVENGAATIEDLGSSNGTKVGDQRLSPNQPTTATSGTPLRFGNWNVVLDLAGAAGTQEPAPATIAMPAAEADRTLVSSAFSEEQTFAAAELVEPPAAEPPMAAVEPVSGGAVVGLLRRIEGAGDDITITEGVITIGRRPENTVVLTGDPYVSGRHAQIVTDSTGVYLEDVGSTNGTVLNGAKVAPNERLPLAEGDELHIGNSKYRIEIQSIDQSEAPPEFDLGVPEPSDGRA
ncbi:MAG TPA: FHA domain-containing protein [Chthonomonadaceae bacterium]|nr:FHA domain-containing protein [Chthonomonadaceae bacterium]